jgi:hypothetical protein
LPSHVSRRRSQQTHLGSKGLESDRHPNHHEPRFGKIAFGFSQFEGNHLPDWQNISDYDSRIADIDFEVESACVSGWVTIKSSALSEDGQGSLQNSYTTRLLLSRLIPKLSDAPDEIC